MATYTIKVQTEKDLPVEVNFPSYYKNGDNEFIWLKSPNEVVKVEVQQYHNRRQYDITYRDFLSPDEVQRFVVCGRKSSETEFLEVYKVAQDVLRDAFVSYKHLDKTLEALELEYTAPRTDERFDEDFIYMEILGRI